MENFKVIIVEDVPLELKGTEGIFKNDIPEAEIIGTAESEIAYWKLIKQQLPDLVLLDLGLGGSTTVGVEICRQTKEQYPDVKWTDILDKVEVVKDVEPTEVSEILAEQKTELDKGTEDEFAEFKM